MLSRIIFLLFIQLIPQQLLARDFSQLAKEPANVVLENDSQKIKAGSVYDLGRYSQSLSPEKILEAIELKQYKHSDRMEYRYGKSAYWLIILDNPGANSRNIAVEFPISLENVNYWQLRNGQLKHLARQLFPIDSFIFEAPAGRTFLVIERIAKGNVSVSTTSVTFTDETLYRKQIIERLLFLGIIFGAILNVVIYSLGMALIFKRSYFFYFAIYNLSVLLSQAFLQGFIAIDSKPFAISSLTSQIFLILIYRSMFSLKDFDRQLFQISNILIIIFLISTIITFISPTFHLIALNIALTALYCGYVSIKKARAGFSPAYFMVLGWIFAFLTVLVIVISFFFFGVESLITYNILGIATHSLCFTLALGHAFRLSEQQAKEKIEHAFNQLKKVFYTHQIEQIEQGTELEQTMPIGTHQAAVICFDIVGSSLIEDSIAKTFVHNAIKRCVLAMTEVYDPKTLTAHAYRIKELGDGFLCSVGFPFHRVSGQSNAEAAVELALEMVRRFQMEVTSLGQSIPVTCAIGIATGELEGRYPTVGVMEYDVIGRAVTLATRYEAMRKSLWPNGLEGDIIIIQNQIYHSLPQDLQALFSEWDLTSGKVKVRDDSSASSLYFRIIKQTESAQLT